MAHDSSLPDPIHAPCVSCRLSGEVAIGAKHEGETLNGKNIRNPTKEKPCDEKKGSPAVPGDFVDSEPKVSLVVSRAVGKNPGKRQRQTPSRGTPVQATTTTFDSGAGSSAIPESDFSTDVRIGQLEGQVADLSNRVGQLEGQVASLLALLQERNPQVWAEH